MTTPFEPDATEPTEPTRPTPPPARRSGGRRALIAAVALLPLLGVGALMVRGASEGSGASSPEDAVRQLVDAVNREDMLSALSVLPPEEVDGVRDLYNTVRDKLADSRVVASKDKPFSGIDVEISDLKLTTSSLGDDVSMVRIEDGKSDVSVDPSKTSARLRDAIGKDAKADHQSSSIGDARRALADSGARVRDVFLMTVRRDGRWYVSPSYTLAEYLRQQFDMPPARFDAEPLGNGAASPTEAVDHWFRNAVDLNADFIRQMPPDRFRVLYDYRPALEEGLKKLKNASEGTSGKLQLDTLDLSAKPLTEHTAKVSIDHLKGSLTFAGTDPEEGSGKADFELTKLCGTAHSVYTYPDGATGGFSEDVNQPEDDTAKGCLTDNARKIPFDAFFVVTRQVKGAWYVDPIGTFVEYGQAFANAVSSKDVDCAFAMAKDDGAGDTDYICKDTILAN